jgi:hypothetical protein
MDCLSEESFSRAQRQLQKLEEETKDALIIVLVNKIDQLLGYKKGEHNIDRVLRNCVFYN